MLNRSVIVGSLLLAGLWTSVQAGDRWGFLPFKEGASFFEVLPSPEGERTLLHSYQLRTSCDQQIPDCEKIIFDSSVATIGDPLLESDIELSDRLEIQACIRWDEGSLFSRRTGVGLGKRICIIAKSPDGHLRSVNAGEGVEEIRHDRPKDEGFDAYLERTWKSWPCNIVVTYRSCSRAF